MLGNTVRMSERCLANLQALMDKHAVIGDVLGKGLFLGAEPVSDRATKEPLDEKSVQAVVAECLAQGVIIGATNRSLAGLNNTLCLSPALIATEDDISHEGHRPGAIQAVRLSQRWISSQKWSALIDLNGFNAPDTSVCYRRLSTSCSAATC